MEPVAHLDFETASPTDLRPAGVHRYWEDPATRAWGFTWSLGDGLYYRWRPGEPDPLPLLEHIAMGGRVVSHGAMFERITWRGIRRKYRLDHWPTLDIAQQDCTMARAAATSLPQSLDELAVVLGQKQRKDKEGSLLMRKMASPRRQRSDGTYEWWDTPENLSRLELYQDQDVRTEEETDTMLPPLTASERAVWELDQVVNDRGIYIDIQSVSRAVDIVEYAKRKANERMHLLTGGMVKKCSEVAQILKFIQSRGLECTALRKGDHDDIMIMGDMAGDAVVREVIELRRESSKTSTAKFVAMLKCVCDDGRLRGQFAYHSTGPGRWAGRLVQPQNLMRVDPETEADMVAYTCAVLDTPQSSADAHDMIAMAGYPVLPALAKAMRGQIKAAPGNKFYGGDFSNIQGRFNAWLAGEQWKLDAFRAYDEGTGPDLYRVSSAGITGKPVAAVTKLERQTTGKVPELACGFQGGVGAFLTMAYTQNPPVKAADMVAPVRNATDPEVWHAMTERFLGAFDKRDLKQDEWTAIKLVVTGWRTRNPMITASWWELQDAGVMAVSRPGVPVPVYNGKVNYLCANGWLYCQLPSGRIINYCNPWIEQTKTVRVKLPYTDGTYRWIDIDDFPVPANRFLPYEQWELEAAGYEITERVKHTVHFMGRDAETTQWVPKALYGGLQCENIVMGCETDVLRSAMLRVEAAHYDIVLHAHDEILSEVPSGFGSVSEYKALMSVVDPWATGLPLATAVWEDTRYVK